MKTICTLLAMLLTTGALAAPPEGKGKAPTFVPPTWQDANGAVIGLFTVPSFGPYGSGICGGDRCGDYSARGNLLIQLDDEITPRVLLIDQFGNLHGTIPLYFDQAGCTGNAYVSAILKGGSEPVSFVNYGLGAYAGVAYRRDATGATVGGNAIQSAVEPDGSCVDTDLVVGTYAPADPVFDVSSYTPPYVVVITR